jgi:hypothetical protein
MSAFKNQIQRDVSNVFLNSDEFSDVHNVDGKDMSIQIDENEALDRQVRFAQDVGIYKLQKIIYVATEDYGKMPYIGKLLILDGLTYKVADVTEESGIYAITIERNKA